MPRGRHRKPYDYSAAARGVRSGVGVAAAGGVIATGFAALPAQADSPHHVWRHVAACESSNRWHIHTGNGFFGGLQFLQATWTNFGGRKYAPRADVAQPVQQVIIARRVLEVQGPRAWPVCGKRAALTRTNGKATRKPLPNIGPYVHRIPHHGAPAPVHHPVHHPRVTRYVVRAGDSLSSIAMSNHVRGGWTALWHYNRTNVPNPNVILVGQILQIP